MKIGILTHYYRSKNYGGTLQAYALTTYLCQQGYVAEQICYASKSDPLVVKEDISQEKNTEEPLVYGVCKENEENNSIPQEKNIIGRVKKSLHARFVDTPRWKEVERCRNEYPLIRKQRFFNFQHCTPHSEKSYTVEDIAEALDYDAYITGSDQVWNLNWFNPAFFLEFVPKDKKKIAYAASAGKSKFGQEEERYLRKVLPTMDAISVREADLVDVYSELAAGTKPVWVLDPVFLLSKKQWDEVASRRLVFGKYVFTYFLGEDQEAKDLASEYAKKTQRKLVNIPFPIEKPNGYISFDEALREVVYADRNMPTADPADFVSLIKYADCVVTDSFHAVAFSVIYQKDFFVFERAGEKEMSSRIRTITQLAGCEESFCDNAQNRTITYMLKKPKNKYHGSEGELNRMRCVSENYLLTALNKEK